MISSRGFDGIFRWLIGCLWLGLSLSALPGPTSARDAAPNSTEIRFDEASFSGLEWRNIGPFRGGRVTAVSGVAGEPLTFYFGATGGGIWKTEDAGTTWRNVSDGFVDTGSVGAIAVAPSDANVVYAGMGEAQIRGVTTSHGNGVYGSTDGGRTWRHLGLEATRQISRIRIHPTDPDLVYVAAQGNPWLANEERGIYRSADGGRTWIRVLAVDAESGASDLAMAADNPRVLYAAFWQHRRRPWQISSGGPGSGLYKSTDQGDTWSRLDKGLPSTMGKVGVAVSPVRSQRVWALVEAEDGGLFRSDDGGESFVHVNRDRILRARAWYYTKVIADPRDADTVYVLNAPLLRSIDGGKTFEKVTAPHGDHHDLWLSADPPWRMINGNDGGANVSWNEGQTWSSQNNQPTGQFYRVITDHRFPYHVYAGQQDNSTIAIASRGHRGIDAADWYPVGGCESAHIAFDPERPDWVYAGCYQGIISEFDVASGQQRNIMAYPFLGLGGEPRDQKYRFNWNAPIVVSPHDPTVLYHAANVVLRSADRGVTWRAISDDLTRNDPTRQGPGGGPITNEAAGAETYNTILYLAPSPHRPGELWAGSDDGRVHVTRDEGATWSEVTPPDLPEAQVNAIEVSPHDPDKIFLAIHRYKLGDDRPYVYVSEDGGISWQQRVEGLRDDAVVRVVREDVQRSGLLYAGTEAGLHVSFDNGNQWHALQLNLPVVPVTDLTIEQGDLVASTQGRGLWILDDLSPLRQWPVSSQAETDMASTEDTCGLSHGFHLYRPAAAHRLPAMGSEQPNSGKNPPPGAILYYHLCDELAASLEASEDPEVESGPEMVLEILDDTGRPVRRFSSRQAVHDAIDPPPAPQDFGYGEAEYLPAKAGLNRFVWDLQGEEVRRLDDLFVLGAKTYRVVPGTYTVRLEVAGELMEQRLEVLPDPRQEVPLEDFVEQRDMVRNIWRRVDDIHRSVARLRDVGQQVEALMDRTGDDARGEDIQRLGQALLERLAAWQEPLVQRRQQTFQDVINFPNRLNAQYLFLLQAIDSSDPPMGQGARQRWLDLEEEWLQHKIAMEKIYALDLATFNQRVDELQIPAILVPELR